MIKDLRKLFNSPAGNTNIGILKYLRILKMERIILYLFYNKKIKKIFAQKYLMSYFYNKGQYHKVGIAVIPIKVFFSLCILWWVF